MSFERWLCRQLVLHLGAIVKLASISLKVDLSNAYAILLLNVAKSSMYINTYTYNTHTHKHNPRAYIYVVTISYLMHGVVVWRLVRRNYAEVHAPPGTRRTLSRVHTYTHAHSRDQARWVVASPGAGPIGCGTLFAISDWRKPSRDYADIHFRAEMSDGVAPLSVAKVTTLQYSTR